MLNFASAFAPERGLAMRSLNELDINEQKQQRRAPSRHDTRPAGQRNTPLQGKEIIYKEEFDPGSG